MKSKKKTLYRKKKKDVQEIILINSTVSNRMILIHSNVSKAMRVADVDI